MWRCSNIFLIFCWYWGLVPLYASHKESTLNQPRVAFVFAGGVRSFILPAIHESIRYNLINSFCPPQSCISDIFVRLSIDDNTHDGAGANAHGLKLSGGKQKYREALNCIKQLAHHSPRAKLIYEVVNIGSALEATEMDAVTSQNRKQKLYRDLDPRRYSMYFNRWSAFNMLLKHENESNMKYWWVVHTRLDAGWGSPIRPHSVWSPQKIWVPDSWPTAGVPDSFALVPRTRADIFFSLNGYFDPPNVMCLGGPNFNPKSLSTSNLKSLGYTADEIAAAQAESCTTKFNARQYRLISNVKENITWTSAGYSEMFLKRKLEYFGVSKKHGNLGHSSFFFFLSRYPLGFVCYNLEPRRFITVADSKDPSETVGVGCYSMWKDMEALHNANYGPNCNSPNQSAGIASDDAIGNHLSGSDSRSSRSGSVFSNQRYHSKQPLMMVPQSTCLLDKQMTDWNFMPFRIRKRGDLCLTYEPLEHAAPATTATTSTIAPPPAAAASAVSARSFGGAQLAVSLAVGMRPCLKKKKLPGSDLTTAAAGSTETRLGAAALGVAGAAGRDGGPVKAVAAAVYNPRRRRRRKQVLHPFYDSSQLFHLYPLSPVSYRISSWDFAEGQGRRCLTVRTTLPVEASPVLEMAPCHKDPLYPAQLFRAEIQNSRRSNSDRNPRSVQLVDPSTLELRDSSSSSSNERALKRPPMSPFPDQEASAQASKSEYSPILPDISTILIRWTGSAGDSSDTLEDSAGGEAGGSAVGAAQNVGGTAAAESPSFLGSDGSMGPSGALCVTYDEPTEMSTRTWDKRSGVNTSSMPSSADLSLQLPRVTIGPCTQKLLVRSDAASVVGTRGRGTGGRGPLTAPEVRTLSADIIGMTSGREAGRGDGERLLKSMADSKALFLLERMKIETPTT